MISKRTSALSGAANAPGDKSISHRALLLSSQRIGQTRITGLLESGDILCTADALRQMGVSITRTAEDDYLVDGVGVGGLSEPSGVLDMGNSGTGARLLMGLVASYPFTSFFTGDHSLCKRPMGRALTPLLQSGASHIAHSGDRLPLAITGSATPLPITYQSPVASAQVKSCILLAGLNIAGTSTVIEAIATRDHTERMMQHLGFALETHPQPNGSTHIQITGCVQAPAGPRTITVPGDPSSAAFPAIAALIVPDSVVTIRNICRNPLRVGVFEWLEHMGAQIEWANPRTQAGEEIADLQVRYSSLRGIDIPASAAPSMIDEYPILAVAAAFAKGTTIMRGLSELRVKESDRLMAVYEGLGACGVNARIDGDDLIVEGCAGEVRGGGYVITHYDHRIAMAFLVMGLASEQQVRVDDASAIGTSFPNFQLLMQELGGFIEQDRRQATRPAGQKRLTIAIDGPAASGKGTLAWRLARHLNLPYLDTGTLYRAVALNLINRNLNSDRIPDVLEAAHQVNVDDLSDPALRQESVGQLASKISAIPEVRGILLDFQRQFALSPQGAILDGRDIGTIVCPEADLKIFMTASLETRAKRRHQQLQGEGFEVVYESVLNGLKERDRRDSERQSAPLLPADDAVYLDTTDMDIDTVFERILTLLRNQQTLNAA